MFTQRNPRSLWRLALLICLIVATSAVSQTKIRDLEPTIILLSIDGMRADYLDKYKPPTLTRIAKQGVKARWLIPSFPTKTFPNHYTIATGLYPAHHGIVENNIWDFGTTFSLSKREEVQNSRWWLGEPIWVTAEMQGLKAGAFFFPGTETTIKGWRPTFWKDYDGKIPNEQRVDTVLGWLDLPYNERPRVFTMYFSDLDDAGHANGPDAPETRDAMLSVDRNIERLVDGLRKRGIEKKINLVIVSDHGMAAVDQRNAVIMDDFFDLSMSQQNLTTGEIWQIFPKQGQIDVILSGLKRIQHANCWRKAEIPERLHYRDGPRVAPIVCSAEEGWFMTTRERYEAQRKRVDFAKTRGAHGYDNVLESMRAVFIARGNAFKKKKVVDPFENINVYELMCKILGLRPAPNDGNLERVKPLLR